MSDAVIEQIAEILNQWNPLGDRAKTIPDLDGYRTEAEDIFFGIELDVKIKKTDVLNLVQDVLNEAFELSLTWDDCKEPADKIASILTKGAKLH